jgi:ketosteroid isomerase-like protein
MSNVRQAIAAGNKRFGDCIAAKDFAGLAACYIDDATLLPPGAPVIKGRAAIRQFWETAVAALGVTGGTLTTHEVDELGDTANEYGTGVLDLETGSALVKYLVIWKRQPDDSWIMQWDIWNDAPA